MKYFKEYIGDIEKQSKTKLEDILDLLNRTEGIKASSYLNKSTPYIFVRSQTSKHINPNIVDLDLGVRLFIAGNKLVYRLQHGPNGTQVGPSKLIEDPEEIENYVKQGKTEQQAYNELFRQIPKIIKTFLYKVYDNLEKQTSKDKLDIDMTKQKDILNSILGTRVNGALKF